jgi:hypothetical protein
MLSVARSQLSLPLLTSYTLTISAATGGGDTTIKSTNPVKVTANTLTYSGNAQKLVTVSNKPTTVTVYYSTEKSLTSSNYTSGSTKIPEETNAGTYTVYYYATGNTTYYTKSGSVDVTINKAAGEIVIEISYEEIGPYLKY